jgi:hypothetical protein
MNPAVQRLLDEREAQNLPRHVTDAGVLAQIAALLNASDGPRRSRQPDSLTNTTPGHRSNARAG